MRYRWVILVVLTCCYTAPVRRQAEVYVPPAPPRETAIGPVAVECSATDHESYTLALRGVAALGFQVTFADSEAGVLQAEQTNPDLEETQASERDRQELWNSLSQAAQYHAIENHSTLLQPASFRRRLMISVSVGRNRAVVTPRVEVCVEQAGKSQCAQRSRFIRSEAQLIERVAAALSTAAAPASSAADQSL